MGNRELIRKEIHKQSGREARKRFFFCYQKAGRWVYVAIYLGNGKMIHAASEERGIVMDNYDYYAQPLCIRNVID